MKYEEAIELYQNFLDSEKELEVHDAKVNNLQLIHTYYNYIEAIEKISQKNTIDLNNNNDSTDSKQKPFKTNFLKKRLKECEQSYMLNFDEEKLKSEHCLIESLEKNFFFSQSKHYVNNYVKDLGELLDDIKSGENVNEFWKKITARFGTNTANEDLNEYVVENLVYGKVVSNIDQIKLVLLHELEKLLIKRENVIDLMMIFFDKKTSIQIKSEF